MSTQTPRASQSHHQWTMGCGASSNGDTIDSLKTNPDTQRRLDPAERIVTEEDVPTKSHVNAAGEVPGCERVPKYITIKGRMMHNDPDVTESWKSLSILGSGATGSVFSCVNDIGQIAAIKVITLDGHNTKTSRALKRELHALAVLQSHPNIVQYYGAVKSELRKCWYVFSELCSNGDLRVMYKKTGALDLDTLSLVLNDMTAGLSHLHETKLVHRDLKGANAFVDESGIVKIGDFGASAMVHTTRKTSIGTLHWMAPEVLSGEGHKQIADVWSLGCVAVELATGDIPFIKLATNPKALCELIFKKFSPEQALPEGTDPLFVSFVKDCLVVDPAQRHTAATLLSHEFLKRWKGLSPEEITAIRHRLCKKEKKH